MASTKPANALTMPMNGSKAGMTGGLGTMSISNSAEASAGGVGAGSEPASAAYWFACPTSGTTTGATTGALSEGPSTVLGATSVPSPSVPSPSGAVPGDWVPGSVVTPSPPVLLPVPDCSVVVPVPASPVVVVPAPSAGGCSSTIGVAPTLPPLFSPPLPLVPVRTVLPAISSSFLRSSLLRSSFLRLSSSLDSSRSLTPPVRVSDPRSSESFSDVPRPPVLTVPEPPVPLDAPVLSPALWSESEAGPVDGPSVVSAAATAGAAVTARPRNAATANSPARIRFFDEFFRWVAMVLLDIDRCDGPLAADRAEPKGIDCGVS